MRSLQQFCWERFRTIDGDGLHPYYLFLTLHNKETICTHAFSREYYEVLCCCRKMFVVKNAWGFLLICLVVKVFVIVGLIIFTRRNFFITQIASVVKGLSQRFKKHLKYNFKAAYLLSLIQSYPIIFDSNLVLFISNNNIQSLHLFRKLSICCNVRLNAHKRYCVQFITWILKRW